MDLRLRFILFFSVIVVITIGIYWNSYDNLSDSKVSNSTSDMKEYFIIPLKEISVSLVWYLSSVLVLSIIFTLISIPLFDTVQNTEVLPFETKDKDLDGNAFSESIVCELNMMEEVLKKDFKKSEAERLPIPLVESSDLSYLKEYKDIDTLSTNIAKKLGPIGNLSIAGLELPVGPLISAVYQCRRIVNKGCVIQGSLQRYDGKKVVAEIEIIIRSSEGKTKYERFKIDGKITNLPDLIKDISIEIVYRVSNERT